jgi:hypothetical protein
MWFIYEALEKKADTTYITAAASGRGELRGSERHGIRRAGTQLRPISTTEQQLASFFLSFFFLLFLNGRIK